MSQPYQPSSMMDDIAVEVATVEPFTAIPSHHTANSLAQQQQQPMQQPNAGSYGYSL